MLFIIIKSPFKIGDEQLEEYQDTLCNDIGDNFYNLMDCIFPVNSKKEKKEDENLD